MAVRAAKVGAAAERAAASLAARAAATDRVAASAAVREAAAGAKDRAAAVREAEVGAVVERVALAVATEVMKEAAMAAALAEVAWVWASLRCTHPNKPLLR